jgi:hypothetical protein
VQSGLGVEVSAKKHQDDNSEIVKIRKMYEDQISGIKKAYEK